MMALLITVAVSALAGGVAWAAVRRWPQADPAAAATLVMADELSHQRRLARFLRSRLDPAVATGLALTAALVGLVVAGAIIGVFVYMVRSNSGVVTIDEHIARWAADNVSGTLIQSADVDHTARIDPGDRCALRSLAEPTASCDGTGPRSCSSSRSSSAASSCS